MSALRIVRFAAVLSTGLVAGIFLGDRMGASFAPARAPALELCDFPADTARALREDDA
jgi:hypothetical protein